MRIGIDARFKLSGGIDHFIVELVNHLAAIDKRHNYYIYVSPNEYIEKFTVSNINFRFIPLNKERYHPMAPFILSKRIRQDKIDVFHALSYWMIPLFSKCPLVVTFHDVLALSSAANTLRAKIYVKIIHRLALMYAAKVITVSKFTMIQLCKHMPRYEKKMVVVHHGIGQHFAIKDTKKVDEVLSEYNLKRGFLLYVGNLKKNKNVPNLLRAYSLFSSEIRKQYPLVIIGGRDVSIVNAAKSFNLSDKEVVFLGHLDDLNTLVFFYNGAKALVMPSTFECFGFPVIEAMACGTPVVCSNASCLPEIAGDAAIYFNPLKIEDIKTALERVLLDDNLCNHLILKGKENIKKFSWFKAAQATLKVYERLYYSK